MTMMHSGVCAGKAFSTSRRLSGKRIVMHLAGNSIDDLCLPSVLLGLLLKCSSSLTLCCRITFKPLVVKQVLHRMKLLPWLGRRWLSSNPLNCQAP